MHGHWCQGNHSNQNCISKDRYDRHHTLPQISALEEVVRQKQREIEDKKNVLQACENVDEQSDSAEKITLIEQICE